MYVYGDNSSLIYFENSFYNPSRCGYNDIRIKEDQARISVFGIRFESPPWVGEESLVVC